MRFEVFWTRSFSDVLCGACESLQGARLIVQKDNGYSKEQERGHERPEQERLGRGDAQAFCIHSDGEHSSREGDVDAQDVVRHA